MIRYKAEMPIINYYIRTSFWTLLNRDVTKTSEQIFNQLKLELKERKALVMQIPQRHFSVKNP